MAKVNFKRVQSVDDLSNLDITDGNFIVTGDGNLFIDYNNQRIAVGGTPDIEMSDVSTNPVQNKIIKKYIDNFIPKGIINTYAGSNAPEGWLICDGSAISRNTYADLFEVIGITYGNGDGETTFNLPDLKGRIPVGYNISDTNFNALGITGGEKKHTLTIDEMPSHSHKFDGVNTGTTITQKLGDYPGYIYADARPNWSGNSSRSVGGGQSHNIMQPYITMNYIIKY